MVSIFFIYGLAFFILGIALLIYPKRDSKFVFARDLYLIGLFGVLHGIKEWLDMFGLIVDLSEAGPLRVIGAALLPISFIPLLIFGSAHIFEKKPSLKTIVPATLVALYLLMTLSDGNIALSSDIWSRYLLAAPGIFMTAFSLIWRLRIEEKAGLHRVSSYIRLSAIGFFLYGIFAGLIVPGGSFFPASGLNYSFVLALTGIPVQVFRAICALFITYGMVRTLNVFDWETREALIHAKDDLEFKVKERTTALRDALSQVKTLSGMLPICAWCKKVRDDKGYWTQVEHYISERSDLDFTHGICPECYKKVSGEEPPKE